MLIGGADPLEVTLPDGTRLHLPTLALGVTTGAGVFTRTTAGGCSRNPGANHGANGGRAGRFDLLLWHKKRSCVEGRFVEAKGPGDRIQPTMKKWLVAARAEGFSEGNLWLAVSEWRKGATAPP